MIQAGTRPFPLKHSDLLPKSENLQRSVMPHSEEVAGSDQKSEDDLKHEILVSNTRGRGSQADNPEWQVADSRKEGFLTTHMVFGNLEQRGILLRLPFQTCRHV